MEITRERLNTLEALAEAVEVPGKTRPKTAWEKKLDKAEAILTIHQSHHKPQDEQFTWVGGALRAIFQRNLATKPDVLAAGAGEQAFYWKLIGTQRKAILAYAKKAAKA